MTRKHVEAVAAELKAVCPKPTSAYTGWYVATVAVANALQGLNRGFDRARFLRDCGVPS